MRPPLSLVLLAIVALSWIAVVQAQADDVALISRDFVFANFSDPLLAFQARRNIYAAAGRRHLQINLLNATEEQKNWLRADFSTMGYPRFRLARFDIAPASTNASGNTSSCDPGNALCPRCDPHSLLPYQEFFRCTHMWRCCWDFTFRFFFQRLIEYRPERNTSDISGTCNANPRNRDIVSQFSLLDRRNWSPMRMQKTMAKANNFTANLTEYCSSLTKSRANVTICMRIADMPVLDRSNHSVGPNRVKINIKISNYRFVRNDTKLALIGMVASNITATKSNEKPRLILFNQEGAIDWDGVLRTEKGPMRVEASELVPLGRLISGVADDDPLRFVETVSRVVFCVNNNTHAMEYDWDPSMEINSHLTNETASNP